jgi:hypothetical protein
MRRTLGGLAILLLLFAGVGFWKNWYSVRVLPGETGHTVFQVDFDQTRAGDDCVAWYRWSKGLVSK